MNDDFDDLFIGKKSMFRALRDAGIKRTQPLRNVRWVNTADDGTPIINVWRSSLGRRGSAIYSDFTDKRRRSRSPARQAKRQELLSVLNMATGPVRVMLLDETTHSGRTAGCKFDTLLWTVHDLGDRYELRRGRHDARRTVVPFQPSAFGVLNAKRRTRVSEQIERLSRVRRVTLERARHRCEVPRCKDSPDFAKVDVHHITGLGDAGADHTDNTVALCPACHARVHRGTKRVSARLQAIVEQIRNAR